MLKKSLTLVFVVVVALVIMGCQQDSRSLKGTWTGTTPDGASVVLEFKDDSALSGSIEAMQAKVILGGTYVESGDELTINATIVDVELPDSIPAAVREPMMKAMEEQKAGPQTGKVEWISDNEVRLNWGDQPLTLSRS
ncbi:MAG: hypothetical protein ACK4P3_08350 [Fimbriimonadaceae bacterium]